ncbi:substrate-binding domain-containing protein, partial [candidate division WOR-3 bacterium]|nr:substrate-binding domain-containing protein [candidate division WOR-3 bacterium]
FIGGCFDIAFPERIKGYKEALKEYGVKFDKALLMITQSQKVKNVTKSIKALLAMKNKPTAIFAINDKAAINVLKALRNLKVRVPEKMSIAGYDNIEAASSLRVPLTTVNTNTSEIGHKAAEALISKIEGKKTENIRKLIEPELIIRKSTVISNS